MPQLTRFINFLFLVYPLLIWALHKLEFQPAVVVFAAIAVLWRMDFKNRKALVWQLALLGLIAAAVALVDVHNLERIYPFFLSVTILGLFASSLRTDKPMLQRYAEFVVTPTERLKKYFWTMTKVWVGVLAINSIILFVLMFAFSFETWLWYAGALSYVLLGTTFVLTILGGHIHQMITVAKIVLGFSIFFLTCFLFSLLLPVLWIGCLGQRKFYQPIVLAAARANFRFVVWYIGKIRMLKLVSKNLPTVQPGSVVIANHVSLFDVLILVGYMQNLYTFVSSKFAANPLMWLIVRMAGFIPISKNNPESQTKAFQQAELLLRDGKSILIFPEATRSKTGQLQEFKKGAFRLAIKLKRPIYSILMTTDGPLLNNLSFLKQDFVKPVSISAMPFQVFSDISGAYGSERLATAALTKTIFEAYLDRLSQPDISDWNRVHFHNQKSYEVSLQHRYVQGHFEGLPLFPAVGQLEWVERALSEKIGKSSKIIAITRAKFTSPLIPPQKAEVQVDVLSQSKASWLVRCGEKVFSKGQFEFRTAE